MTDIDGILAAIDNCLLDDLVSPDAMRWQPPVEPEWTRLRQLVSVDTAAVERCMDALNRLGRHLDALARGMQEAGEAFRSRAWTGIQPSLEGPEEKGTSVRS